MQQVKFTTYGSAHGVGGFAPGTLATVPPEMAHHLVNEVGCAEFVQAPRAPHPVPAPAPQPAPQAEAKPSKTKAAKTKPEESAQ